MRKIRQSLFFTLVYTALGLRVATAEPVRSSWCCYIP